MQVAIDEPDRRVSGDGSERFEGWAILELMGHRRLAGYVQEAELAGGAFLRLDVPDPDELPGPIGGTHAPLATQFYAPHAVYCLTPTTEETAREVARLSRPQPVKRWELPPAPTRAEEPPGF